MKTRKQNQIYGRWIHASFTKWNILNPLLFPNIDKIVLLDADMMVLQNIDDLFDLPSPALTFSTPWARPYGQNKKSGGNYSGTVNRYFNAKYERELVHGQIVPRKAIMESLDNGFVGLACMVLVSPNTRMYETMHAILSYKSLYGATYCISGFDEQLIAETLLLTNKPIYHIHQQYNWIVGKVKWLKPGVLPKTQQFYNGKPWDNITDSASRSRIVELSQWGDIRSWWQSADRIINQYPDDSKWFYTGGIIIQRTANKDNTCEYPAKVDNTCEHPAKVDNTQIANTCEHPANEDNISMYTFTIDSHISEEPKAPRLFYDDNNRARTVTDNTIISGTEYAADTSGWKIQRKKKEYTVERNCKWR